MQQGRQQQEPAEAIWAFTPERSRNPRPSGRGGCQAGRVNRYFALSALNEIIFSRLLDDEDAMAFRVSIAVFESAVVVHNAAIGIKFGSFF